MSPDRGRNLILVGPARSGTTLACSLLNEPGVVNTVALDEPHERSAIAETSPAAFLNFVDSEFGKFRRTLLEEGEAVCTVGAQGLTNHYDAGSSAAGLRGRVVSSGKIRLNKSLDRDFCLAVKHTIPFTAMLDQLRERYPVYAIIRNPVAILASWNTIDASYREGLPPSYAAHLCGDMPWLIKAVRDRFERQVVLLAWHFEQYLPLLREGRVVRYEDMIDSDGRALDLVSTGVRNLSAPLSNQNFVSRCQPEVIEKINISLHRLGGVIWEFYERHEVDDVTRSLIQGQPTAVQRG